MRALLAPLLAVLTTGCIAAEPFACERDEQCVAAGIAGSCQAVGFCSFPDPACASGQRFASSAAADYADACVGDLDDIGGAATDAGTDEAACLAVVTAGAAHGCAIDRDGRVWCWGDNERGQLGDGTTTATPTPRRIDALTDVVALATGAVHSCAVLGDGSAWCWGGNDDGQLGDGSFTDRASPTRVAGLAEVVALAVGERHTCALRGDGSVACWGRNRSGELGDGSGVDGRAIAGAIPGLDGVVALSASGHGSHSCARRGDGSVWCWGQNAHGQIDSARGTHALPVEVPALADATALAIGGDHTCALRAGEVLCQGRNKHGQLGGSSDDDPVVAVELPLAATAVSAGAWHSCALLTDGGVSCWGRNHHGQLGDGTTSERRTPVAVGGLGAATAVAAGETHSCALAAESLWCWGGNDLGQLAGGADADRHEPVPSSLTCP